MAANRSCPRHPLPASALYRLLAGIVLRAARAPFGLAAQARIGPDPMRALSSLQRLPRLVPALHAISTTL